MKKGKERSKRMLKKMQNPQIVEMSNKRGRFSNNIFHCKSHSSDRGVCFSDLVDLIRSTLAITSHLIYVYEYDHVMSEQHVPDLPNDWFRISIATTT